MAELHAAVEVVVVAARNHVRLGCVIQRRLGTVFGGQEEAALLRLRAATAVHWSNSHTRGSDTPARTCQRVLING